MRSITNCCLVLLLIGGSNTAYSYDKKQVEKTPVKQLEQPAALNVGNYEGWLMGVGYFSLEKNNAAAEGVGSNATFIKLGWEGQKGSLTYAIGMEAFLLSDKDSFNVTVEDGFGDVSTQSSTAEGYGVYGELGYSVPFSNNMKIDLMGGLDLLWASRGVGNCSDCPSEDVNLDGGLYLEPRLRIINESGFNFSIGYRSYLSGDIENGFSLNFSWINPS
jgi:hypothetical protein